MRIKVEILYELGGKFWHTNCPKNTFNSGIMIPVLHTASQSLLKCLHCGQHAFYPVGGIGKVCSAHVESVELSNPVLTEEG